MTGYNLITILGPTASGKTRFGAYLAHLIGGEIISADSRQVYRGMDLGTGKDYQDYEVEGHQIPFHLIDIHDAGYRYSVYEFQNDFKQVFEAIRDRECIPMMVGGTGMYLEAILNRYQLVRTPLNPQLRTELKDKTQDELVEILKAYGTNLHNTSDLKIRKRTLRAIEIADHHSKNPVPGEDFPVIQSLVFGVKYDRKTRREKISQRLRARLEEGMIEEVKKLMKKVSQEDLVYYGLEYKYLAWYLSGQLDYTDMVRKLEVAIHQFAKRQMTWFRRMERKGCTIHWLDGHAPMEEKLKTALDLIHHEAPWLMGAR